MISAVSAVLKNYTSVECEALSLKTATCLVSHITKKNGCEKRGHKGEQKFVFLKKGRTAGAEDKP